MKSTTHIRKGRKITIIGDNPQTTKFESINAAKRESRKIQMDADGALGRGTVSVMK